MDPLDPAVWERGRAYGDFRKTVSRQAKTFDEVYAEPAFRPQDLEALRRLPSLRIVAIGGEECPGFRHTLPSLARIAESLGWDLRVAEDKDALRLMSSLPWQGRPRRLPVYVFYRDDGSRYGWWSGRDRGDLDEAENGELDEAYRGRFRRDDILEILALLESPGRQFENDVLPLELDYVRQRRLCHGRDDEPRPQAAVAANSLTGLALSGGGIRSATFNLGLLQAFDANGLVKHVDYLSTVSGGGFLGSSLTALMAQPGQGQEARQGPGHDAQQGSSGGREDRAQGEPPAGEPQGDRPGVAKFPFPPRAERPEADAVQYLRGHSDYLARGLTDYLRAFALLARGIVLNFALLLPVLLIIGLIATFFFMDDLMAAARRAAAAEVVERAAARREAGAGGRLFGPVEPPAVGGAPAGRFAVSGKPGGSAVAAGAEDQACEPGGPPRDRLPTLTYSHAEGLRAWGARGAALVREERGERAQGGASDPCRSGCPGQTPPQVPCRSIELWTEGAAVVAAALTTEGPCAAALTTEGPRVAALTSEDPGDAITGGAPIRCIAAAGHDGSIWLFEVERHGGDLRRQGGRLLRYAKPLAGLAFAGDGSRLLADLSGGGIEEWRLDVKGSPPGTIRRAAAADAVALDEPAGAVVDRLRASRVEEWGERYQPQRAGWDPSRFRLPTTGRALTWVLLIFVGLYPLAALLSGPLAGAVEALRTVGPGLDSWLPSLWWKGDAWDAERGGSTEDRHLVAAGWVALSLLVAVPLFALLASRFDRGALEIGTQQMLWPAVGLGAMALWWVLSLLSLGPQLRRWSKVSEKRPTETESLGAALLLLLPWAVVWVLSLPARRSKVLADLFVPDERVWYWPHWGVILLVWFAGCLLLLQALLSAEGGSRHGSERWRRQRRRMGAGLYAAFNLPLWIFLIQGARHDLPRDLIGYLVEAVVKGFGWDSALLAPPLTVFAVVGFYAVLQFLAWKAFARLALGRDAGAPAGAAADGAAGRSGRSTAAPAADTMPIVWRERYEKAFSLALVAVAAIAFVEVQPYLIHHFHRFDTLYAGEWPYFLAAAWLLALVLAAMFVQLIGGAGKPLVLACLGVLGPLLPLLVYLKAAEALVYGESWYEFRWTLFGPISPWTNAARPFFYVLVGVAFAYLVSKLVDANSTSMHGFYRDRLSQAYLVGVDEDGILGPEEELKLTRICRDGSGAPYHLINASLNLQRESTGAHRWRKSDFFVFSRFWCGGPCTEYCRTEHLEYLAPGIHLGSAMAVSGAAATANRGAQTSPFLVMVMTLLNVRLGLWLPTPRRVNRMQRAGLIEPEAVDRPADRLRRWWLRLRNRPSGYYVVKEMASSLDASGPYVNLSDGGHLENTGAYELLRRRCRFIIISDAESDPETRFEAVAILMRYASIDLDVEIDLDLEPLRPRADGTSAGHWAVGRISYPPRSPGEERQDGLLLYVKASVTGDESEIIREYRARHPDFPQESTADQVFEEDQFEAYRSLGFHIGNRLAAHRRGGQFGGTRDIESWLRTLAGGETGRWSAAWPGQR